MIPAFNPLRGPLLLSLFAITSGSVGCGYGVAPRDRLIGAVDQTMTLWLKGDLDTIYNSLAPPKLFPRETWMETVTARRSLGRPISYRVNRITNFTPTVGGLRVFPNLLWGVTTSAIYETGGGEVNLLFRDQDGRLELLNFDVPPLRDQDGRLEPLNFDVPPRD